MTNLAVKSSLKNDLIHLTLAEARCGLEEKKFSAVELTKAYLSSMEDHRHLNAYILE
ncbi:MAG: hypothetical protein JNJ47_04180, partial [Alphaproteobacteria bacterium]|nr:hypothetical protein [Alphaproteobacteria bacterium]